MHLPTPPALTAVLLALLLNGGCAVAPGPNHDRTNALDLNEMAAASAARGEIETAWLLLERAARLAPHDPRIAANLAAIRSFRGASPRGQVVGEAPPAANPSPATGRPAVMPAAGGDR